MGRHRCHDKSCASTGTDCSSSGTTVDCFVEKCDKSSSDCSPVTFSSLPSSAIPLWSSSSCGNKANDCCPPRFYSHHSRDNEGNFGFKTLITPLTDLKATSSTNGSDIEFRMRRKNRTVTMQWEPFSGNLGASGIANLNVNQSITNLPPYPVSIPYMINYKGKIQHSYVLIDPSSSVQIKMFIMPDGSSGTSIGDAIVVPGGNVTWIID